jgi:hypothetical protein
MGNLFTRLAQSFTGKELQPEACSQIINKYHVVTSDLGFDDSKLFEALCQFMWVQGEPLPLILDLDNEIYTKQGITLSALKRLEEIGLVTFAENGFVKKKLGKHTRLFYCGKPTKIGFPNDENNQLDLGFVCLSEQGKALVNTFNASRNQAFYEYVIGRWFQQGFVLSSIQVDQHVKQL